MTVENSNRELSYTGNDSTTTFAYNFLVYSADHFFVYFDGVQQTTGFIISGIGEDSGGGVTFDVAPLSGVIVKLERIVPLTQLIDFQQYGPFDAESNERGLDLGVMQAIQVNAESEETDALTKRSIRVADGDPTLDEDLVISSIAVRAGKFLGYDGNGKVIEKTVESSEGVTFSEEIPLLDGQTTVVFSSVTSDASFYICGNDADSGRLCSYGITNPTTIELNNSYPEGTTILGIQNDNTLNPSAVTSFNGRDGIVTPLASDYTPAFIGALASGDNVSELVNDANYATVEDNPNDQTGTAYTLLAVDAGEPVWMDSASANILTVALNATENLPLNTPFMIMQEGVGITSITAVAGVTINGIDGGSGDLTQYVGVVLIQRTTNNWVATPLTVA